VRDERASLEARLRAEATEAFRIADALDIALGVSCEAGVSHGPAGYRPQLSFSPQQLQALLAMAADAGPEIAPLLKKIGW
jgi:hypothetical protein